MFNALTSPMDALNPYPTKITPNTLNKPVLFLICSAHLKAVEEHCFDEICQVTAKTVNMHLRNANSATAGSQKAK